MKQNETTYFLDSRNLIEMSRLITQEKIVNDVVGLVDPLVCGDELRSILDMGSGPGGWMLELCKQYPELHAVGIETSEYMLSLSRLLAKAEGQSEHLQFICMDACKELEFPDNSFDYVQMRLTHSFIRPYMWPNILKEVYRVLRPGGYLRFIDLEMTYSNKVHTEKMYDLIPRTWYLTEKSFSPTGKSMGILTKIRKLLVSAQFQNIVLQLYPLEADRYSEYHKFEVSNVGMVIKFLHNDFVEAGYSSDELATIFENAQRELDEDDYTSISLLFSCCARKKE